MADVAFTKVLVVDGVTAVGPALLNPIGSAIDAIVHKANRGGAVLDSDTVSPFGIGVVPASVNAPDINSAPYINGGKWLAVNPTSAGYTYKGGTLAAAGFSYALLETTSGLYGGNNFIAQTLTRNGGAASFETIKRVCYNGTWGNWYQVWDSLSDGNGGRPPVGKGLVAVTASLAQNAYLAITLASNGVYLVHLQNAIIGGHCSSLVFNYTGTSGASSISTVSTASIVCSGADIRLTNLSATPSVLRYTICKIGE